VTEGGGKVLVDEKTLWPQGQYTTTVLIVKEEYLAAHADVIQNLIAGLDSAIALTKSDPAQAQQLTNDGLTKLTGKALKPDVIKASFAHITFTTDPIASSLQTSADNAKTLGFLKTSVLRGIFDLTILNKVRQAAGQPAVAST